MNKVIDFFLPPFVDTAREKSRDMLYVAHETPPWPTVITGGIQHTLIAMMLVVYMVIAGTDVGLSGAPFRGFVTMGIVIMGIGTLLNGLATRISGGHLLVHIPSPITMIVFVAVVNTFGLGAAAGATLIAGIVVFFMGRFLPGLRVLFPPEVTGVLLLLLGMSLLPGGVRRCTGLVSGGGLFFQFDHMLIAAATLGTLTTIAVWSSARLRILGLVLGTASGLLVAVLTGRFGATELAAVAGQPLFSLPISGYPLPALTWVPGAIIPFVLANIITAVDTIGCGVVIDRMNNNQWRRADLSMIGRFLNCMGICISLCGLGGTLATGCSSANLGLAHATGVASRRVGITTGILLIVIAFFPQIAMFIVVLPAAVVGAIMIYAAAYMMVAGAELILSRLLNSRRRAAVGFGLAAGTAVMLVPELTASVPVGIKPLLGSGLIVGVVTSAALNLVFRIGISQGNTLTLDGTNPSEQAARFLENCGEAWGARRDVVTRAGLAVGQALETLQETGLMTGTARLSAGFNENRLVLVLDYPGKALYSSEVRLVDWNSFLKSDHDISELDDALKIVSHSIIRTLADRIETGEGNGRGRLSLFFEH